MARKKKQIDAYGNEVPTLEQLGVSHEEFDRRFEEDSVKSDKWYSAIVEVWQSRRKSELIAIDAKKAEKQRIEELNHWYNSLSKEKVGELITQSIDKKDEIISDMISHISKRSPLTGYYFSLGSRIVKENLETPKAAYKKLKKFPRYNSSSDRLVGSSDQFVTMFIVCFPPLDRKIRKMF